LGNSRGRLGDITDYMPLFTTAINDAASVAQVALRPPSYSSVVNPYTGASSVTAYGPVGNSSQFSASGLGGSLTGSLSPIWLLGGFGLLAIVLLKR
jgi:hypothetical protein